MVLLRQQTLLVSYWSLQVVCSLCKVGSICNDLRVPNGAFQTAFFRFLVSACDRGEPLQRKEECLKTPVL